MDNMQEQMRNISKEVGTPRKNQKEVLEIKNTVTDIKNASDSLINRLSMAKENVILKVHP